MLMNGNFARGGLAYLCGGGYLLNWVLLVVALGVLMLFCLVMSSCYWNVDNLASLLMLILYNDNVVLYVGAVGWMVISRG